MPAKNRVYAIKGPSTFIVSLSGGIASAVAADRAIERYGRDAVRLWFADTSWEDPDLHRFMRDCMQRWGGELVVHKDGKTPLQVAEDRQIIPNNRMAPCSFELKIAPFRRYLQTLADRPTILLGLDWREQHRHVAPKRNYGELGYLVDFPLLWKPIEYRPYVDVVKSWGIDPPRLYALGFPHNNCGGRCIRQGQREWRRLLSTFPERFAEVRDWESEQRKRPGGRRGKSILRLKMAGESRPLPLEMLEELGGVDGSPTQDDLFSCFCDDV